MSDSSHYEKSLRYLELLCQTISDRSVGSVGNREASSFFEKELASLGWKTHSARFEAIDWSENGVVLRCGDMNFNAFVSPYSLAYKGEADLLSISTSRELETLNIEGKIVLLHGDIAREQLMPKNFVFYNPEEHQKIISLLEKGKPAAIISATGRNAALAGGVYPFPLIEDGDFDVPSVYMTEEEGVKLALCNGKRIFLHSESERIPSYGFNITGTKGSGEERIVVTAHIDAKKGSPGAIDNATGVIVLLLLADLLKDYEGEKLIEIVAFNGEDYYAVPGQMKYIEQNYGRFGNMILNINIDGAGYHTGVSSFSLFSLPPALESTVKSIIAEYPGIEEGIQWPQGDHSIFLQSGVPAIAVSSKWFIDNIEVQDITHTSKDNTGIVDCRKITEIASALEELIQKLQ